MTQICANAVDFSRGFLPKHFPCAPSWYHYDMLKRAEGKVFSAFAAPRDHGKSTLWELGHTLWRHCLNQAKITVLLGSVDKQAAKWLRRVARELKENKNLRDRFAIACDSPWREEDEIHFTVDGVSQSILARGAGTNAVRGDHPDDIKGDDFQDTYNVRSDIEREALDEWCELTLIAAMEEQSTFTYTSTLLHPLSMMVKFAGDGDKQKPLDGWGTGIYDCVQSPHDLSDPECRVLWPEKCSRLWLLRQSKNISRARFYRDYRNKLLSEGEVMVDEKAIERMGCWRDPETLHRGSMWVVSAIDIATTTTDKSDYTAIGVIGLYLDGPDEGKYRILEVIRGRWGTDEKLKRAIDVYRRWRPAVFAVETNSQKDLATVLDREARKLSYNVNWKPITHASAHASKRGRILATAHFFERGLVLFGTDLAEEARNELFLWPATPHDDQMDVVATCLLVMNEDGIAARKHASPIVHDGDLMQDLTAMHKKGRLIQVEGGMTDTMNDIRGTSQDSERYHLDHWLG